MYLVPVFRPIVGDVRLTALPVSRPKIHEMYNTATQCFWTTNEVNTSEDAEHYNNKLTNEDKHLVKYILAFFASSDGLVNVNITERFKNEVPMQDAIYFYNFQLMMEDVHANMYSILLDTIIPSQEERDQLISASHNIPVIKSMTKFMTDCTESDAPFAERLLRFACVEGIFFTGCFCVIYWLQFRGLMPGLGHSNELIARDEKLHTEFGLLLYTMIEPEHKLSHKRIYEIFREAVDIAVQFINGALPTSLQEMNANLMKTYIENQADILLGLIGLNPLYKVEHQFHFMNLINMARRTNFFEKKVSDYSKMVEPDTKKYEIADDF